MNVQFKGGLILIVLVAALYYVFPTFKAYQGGVDPQTVADKVNLGLDLQGGSHLLLRVDMDAARDRLCARPRRESYIVQDGRRPYRVHRKTSGAAATESHC